MRGMSARVLGWLVALSLGCGGEASVPATQLAFRSEAHSIIAGDCSDPVVLELRDDAGTQTPAPRAFEVTVDTVEGEPLRLYADASCATPLAQVPFAAGMTQASFYFTSTVAGQRTLRATSRWPAVTQVLTVRAGRVASITLEPIADTRVGVPFEVTAHGADAFGNPIDELLGLGFEPDVAPWSCYGGCGRSSSALFSAGTFRATLSVDGAVMGVRLRLFNAPNAPDSRIWLSNPFDVSPGQGLSGGGLH